MYATQITNNIKYTKKITDCGDDFPYTIIIITTTTNQGVS